MMPEWWAHGPVRLFVAVVTTVLLAAGCSFSVDEGSASGSADETGAGESGGDGSSAGLASSEDVVDLTDLPALAARISPSVVAIEASIGEGSGVIWSSDGTIVTNFHVVGDATSVDVLFADGSRLEADVVAGDPFTDLAVLQITETGLDLPALDVAPEQVDVGTPVLAIGNPLGFENSVTFGIVSGVQRSIPGGGGVQSLVDLVQTDAAISPGNSGGALVDLDGDLVGVNVAYLPPASRAVSVGFAIPSPTVIHVVDSLLADGFVRHSYLGVQLAPLDARSVERLPGSAETGVIVTSVEPGGPATAAGVERGDVITAIDDESIESIGDLLGFLRRSQPGQSVALEVVRGGDALTLTAELTERPVGG